MTEGRKRFVRLMGLGLMLLASVLFAMTVGSSAIAPFDIGRAMIPHSQVPADIAGIVLDIRLPRVLLALLAGAGLALTGTGTQAVLNNPLVSPSILGLSAGAAFGACAAILFAGALQVPGGHLLIAICAFGGAMAATVTAYLMASVRRSSRETVILAGVAVGFIFSGGTVLLQYLAPWQDLRAMVFWSVGSLWNAQTAVLPLVGGTVALGGLALVALAPRLNALALGDETAMAVGVSVRRVRLLVLSISALVCAVIVSSTGAIGFIGLIAPHIARMIFGQDHRWLLPASCLTGGLLLLLADTLARSILSPQELPVGVMTALVGGPFFLFLLLRRQKDWWGTS